MSKAYNIGLQRYRDYEIIVCGKYSISLFEILRFSSLFNFKTYIERDRGGEGGGLALKPIF